MVGQLSHSPLCYCEYLPALEIHYISQTLSTAVSKGFFCKWMVCFRRYSVDLESTSQPASFVSAFEKPARPRRPSVPPMTLCLIKNALRKTQQGTLTTDSSSLKWHLLTKASNKFMGSVPFPERRKIRHERMSLVRVLAVTLIDLTTGWNCSRRSTSSA